MKNILKICVLVLFIPVFMGCSRVDRKGTSVEEKNNTKSLIALMKFKGAYGYINAQGDVVISPKFMLARTFSMGYAAVSGPNYTRESDYRLIDTSGEMVFNATSFEEIPVFKENFARVLLADSTYGFINRKGEIVISGLTGAANFHEGLAAAINSKTNTLGYIDTLGNWVITMDRKYLIGDFYDGMAFIEHKGKYGFINKKGEIVIEPQFQEAYDFKEDLVVIARNDSFGFANKKGEVVIPYSLFDVDEFYEGFCAAEKDGKWGFINKKGDWVIEPKFMVVRSFHEGLAAVMEKDKVGYIDYSGEYVIQPKFEYALDFKNGFAIFQQNGGFGLIDKKGEIAVIPIYEYIGDLVDPHAYNEDVPLN